MSLSLSTLAHAGTQLNQTFFWKPPLLLNSTQSFFGSVTHTQTQTYTLLSLSKYDVQGVTPLQDELNRYFADFTSVEEDTDPIEYWNEQKLYPLIGDLAVDYLVTPCSSSSVESMFSHAGFLCSGMRSRVSPENLEAQVLIKTNFLALK